MTREQWKVSTTVMRSLLAVRQSCRVDFVHGMAAAVQFLERAFQYFHEPLAEDKSNVSSKIKQ